MRYESYRPFGTKSFSHCFQAFYAWLPSLGPYGTDPIAGFFDLPILGHARVLSFLANILLQFRPEDLYTGEPKVF